MKGLSDLLTEGVALLDASGSVTHANRRIAHLLCMRNSELLGRSMSDFVAAPVQVAFRERIASAQDGSDQASVFTLNRGAQPAAVRLLRLSDTWACLEATDSGEAPPAGDGTAGVPASAAGSEGLFRTIFEASSLPMALSDPENRVIVRANSKLSSMLGYADGELNGMPISSITHRDDMGEDMRLMERLLRGELGESSLDKRYLRKDGTVTWGRLNLSLMRGNGCQPDRMIAIIEPMQQWMQTELLAKRSEATLRAAFATMTDAVCITDIDGGFVEFNEAFASFNRFKSKAECLATLSGYKELFEIFQSDGTELAFEAWPIPRALRGETVVNAEYIIGRRDTGEKWDGSYSFAPIRDDAGAIVGSVVVGRDITKQKRDLRALDEGDRRYRALFENMNEGLASCRMIFKDGKAHDFLYLGVNDSFAELTGLRDVVGKTFSEVVPGVHEKDPEVFEPYGRVVRTGKPEKFERYNKALRRWFKLSVYPAEPGCFVCLVELITERKMAEAALRQSEAILRGIFNAINDAAVYTGSDRRILMVNPAFEELFGYHPDEKLNDTTEFMYADPADYHAQGSRVYSLETGRSDDRRELRYVRKDGTTFWAESSGSKVVDSSGQVTGYIGIHRDVTVRRLAENALRERTAFFEAQIESSPDGVLVVNENGQKMLQNHRLTEMFRIPREVTEDRDSSRTHAHLCSLTTNPRESGERVKSLYATPTEVGREKLELSDGRIVERFSAPVRDASGRYYGRIWTYRDITDTVQLEKQFLRAQRMEAIGTLASGIAHDLNNILSPLLIATGLLEEKVTDPGDREMMRLVEASAQRGAGIIRQLLTFSRGIDGQRVAVQVRHLIKETAGIARETFPRNITVVELSASDLWPVFADATQLHQVLMNLAVNSRDAMPEGGDLRFSAENLDLVAGDRSLPAEIKPGKFVRVTVQDTGHGIPPKIIDKIFDPFFTTKGIGKGSGLGLSSVLGIVRSHGGFVTVESQPGSGASFHVHLPASPDASTARTTASEAVPLGSGELILVVDDEAQVIQAVEHCLSTHGYRVLTARDGRQALMTFVSHQQEVRLVLTDVMMPIMDGIKLAKLVHGLAPKVPVIASSGLERSAQSVAEISEFLDKPYESRELLAAVGRHLKAQTPP